MGDPEMFLSAVKFLAIFIGVGVGLMIGSLISAIWLRLAAQFLSFNRVPYLTAFKISLVSNFVMFVLNFSIGANQGLALAAMKPNMRRLTTLDYGHYFSPIYFLLATVGGVLLTALVIGRMLPREEKEPRVSFGDTVVLSSLYIAISFVCMFLVLMIAFSVAMSVLNLFD